MENPDKESKDILEEIKEEVSKGNVDSKEVCKTSEKHYYRSKDKELLELYRQFGIDQANESAGKIRSAQEIGASGIVETRDDFKGLAFTDRKRVTGMTKKEIEGITYFEPKDEKLKEEFSCPKKHRTGDFIANELRGSPMGGSILSWEGEYMVLESVTKVIHDKLEEIDFPTYDLMMSFLYEKMREMKKEKEKC